MRLLNFKKVIFILILFILFFAGLSKSGNIALFCGNYFYKKADFSKSLFFLNYALKYDFFVNRNFSENSGNICIKIINCYSENGDILNALRFCNDTLKKIKDKSIEQEAFENCLKMEIAEKYYILGYYDKSLNYYISLQNWYPQNLIRVYLALKQYQSAKDLLFSDDIQTVIAEGDDSDSAALLYLLLKYYEETNQTDKIFSYQNADDNFEYKLIKEVVFADLYFSDGDYKQAVNLYEKILLSPYLENSSEFKIKLRYALLNAKTGQLQEAKNVYKDIISAQKNLYKYSPQKICTTYYSAEIYPEERDFLIKKSQELFKGLKLNSESYFYNNIEEFCKINTQF